MTATVVTRTIKELVRNTFATRPKVKRVAADWNDLEQFIVRSNGQDYLVTVAKIIKEVE